MKNKKWIVLLSFFGLIIFFASGFSLWMVNEKSITCDFTLDVKQAVAYYGQGKDRKYFTSVEGAVTSAGSNSSNDIVYVIPGTNPTILSNFTIAANDTLCLPYSGEEYHKKYTKTDEGDTSGFADNDCKKYRKSKVTISSGCSITVNGTMIVGGLTGGASPQGATNGDYSEILMEENTSISLESGSTLFCYGFIKEKDSAKNAMIHVADEAKVYEPAVIYDWATATKVLVLSHHGKIGGIAGDIYNDIFPFNRYDFPNIRPTLRFSYGSTLWGIVHTFGTNAGHLYTNVKILSKNSDSFAVRSPGAVIYWHFKDSNKEVDENWPTKNDGTTHKTTIEMTGECKLGKLNVSLTVNGYSIVVDSSNYFLPIPYLFEIVAGQGGSQASVVIPNRVKFLPGSSLTILKGSSVQFDNDVVFYQKNRSDSLTNPQPITYDYSNNTAATLNNGGTLIINKGFGGVINPTDESAILTIGQNYSRVQDCYEGLYQGSGVIDTLKAIWTKLELDGKGEGVKYGPYASTGGIVPLVRKIYSYNRNDNSITSKISDMGKNEILSGFTYLSEKTSDNNYSWNLDYYSFYGVKFVLDPKNEFSDAEEIKNPNSENLHVDRIVNKVQVLEALSDPSGKKLFKGFSYDSLGTDRLDGNGFTLNIDKAINKLVNSIVTVYANWNDAEMPVAKIRTAYYEGNKLVTPDSYSSVDAGVVLPLGDLTIRDREGGTDKDNFKVTYDNVDWLVKDETDSTETHVTPGSSFVPQAKHSYTIEPIYKTHYFLRINVTNKKHDWRYAIQEIKIIGNNVDLKQNDENTQTAWIESTDKLYIHVQRLYVKETGCTIDIPGGYQQITIGNGKDKEIDFTTATDSNNKPLLDAFMNRTGPINVKGTIK